MVVMLFDGGFGLSPHLWPIIFLYEILGLFSLTVNMVLEPLLSVLLLLGTIVIISDVLLPPSLAYPPLHYRLQS